MATCGVLSPDDTSEARRPTAHKGLIIYIVLTFVAATADCARHQLASRTWVTDQILSLFLLLLFMTKADAKLWKAHKDTSFGRTVGLTHREDISLNFAWPVKSFLPLLSLNMYIT